MNQRSDSQPRSHFYRFGGGLLAALILVSIWWSVHPVRPHLQTSDLFTHLSVARHLLRGEGFVTDITYPLSFAYDFARELPQPLIHRGPGYALLLTIPLAPVPDDPVLAVDRVRWLQVFFLGVIAWAGATRFFSHRNIPAAGAWLVLLLMSPLLDFSVDWGFSELPAALLLLLLWLRHRDLSPPGPGLIDGLLAGALVLLRGDLFWLPLLWWFWGRRELRTVALRDASPANASLIKPFWSRRLMLALVMMLVVNLPWLVRNMRLADNPVFTLQGQAELIKDTRTWPGYSVYRQLEPQPLAKVLSEDPVPVLRKFVRGLKFYFRELGRLFPWVGLILTGLVMMVYLRGGIDHKPCLLRPGAQHPLTILPAESPLGPLVVVGTTLVLMIVQYSFFDHSLRHLLVLYPVMAWELAGILGVGLAKLMAKTRFGPWIPVVPAILATVILVRLSLQPLPGWNFSAEQARKQSHLLEAKIQGLRQNTDSVPFVESSAAPWYADRPAVWAPLDDSVRETIRKLLSPDTPESAVIPR
jgi:hypothetical protein